MIISRTATNNNISIRIIYETSTYPQCSAMDIRNPVSDNAKLFTLMIQPNHESRQLNKHQHYQMEP